MTAVVEPVAEPAKKRKHSLTRAQRDVLTVMADTILDLKKPRSYSFLDATMKVLIREGHVERVVETITPVAQKNIWGGYTPARPPYEQEKEVRFKDPKLERLYIRNAVAKRMEEEAVAKETDALLEARRSDQGLVGEMEEVHKKVTRAFNAKRKPLPPAESWLAVYNRMVAKKAAIADAEAALKAARKAFVRPSDDVITAWLVEKQLLGQIPWKGK